MSKKRSSITFTVFAGYFLLAALGGYTVWFIYGQVIDYTRMTERNTSGNRKLLLVSEAATKLYEAESQSRQLIQSGTLEGFEDYTQSIDSIKQTLASLQDFREDSFLDREIDSISLLLSQKSENLQELLELRARGETDSYYSRVLNELQKVDEVFEEPNYDQRFRDLEPHQRGVLIKLLEYARVENPERANITVDSLVNSVKRVLSELEMQERNYRRQLRMQENQLLANEVQLNSRLRSLLSTIENEERVSSIEQVAAWQETVEETSKTIAFLGAVSLLVILIFVFLVIRDVSRSQQYRRQLESAKGYAESLLKSREQFMNTVTHDLRSPLNAIVGYTGLLKETALNKSQNRYLGQLKRSSDYLLHLVNDLLDLSRLEAGKMSIEKISFSPRDLIEEAVENAIPPDKPENVTVEVDIAPELKKPVMTDPFRIKQILTNLVSNACKFTKEGKIEVKAWREKEWDRDVLVIMVKDTGIGISKEQKEKVFEEFSQENSSIEKKYGGSGLGLAISKKITDLLKGSISLESEPGKGSTFTLKIPVRQPDRLMENGIPEDFPSGSPEKYCVLIADDEPAQLGLLKEFIRSTGMDYTTAKDGKQALKKLKKEQIDLILTDIQMPEMNGIELLKELKKDPALKDIPVIALSGQVNVSPADYLQKGFSGSLLKPYSSKKLLQLIGDVLKVDLQKKEAEKRIEDEESQLYTLSEIRTFSGDDKEALNSILTAFIESTGSNLIALQMAFQKEDFERISSVAHKMLPMFRQLKAGHLIHKLELMENSASEAVKNVDLALFSQEVQKLLEQLQQEIKD